MRQIFTLSHHDLRPVLQRLRQMRGLDFLTPCQVHDSTRQGHALTFGAADFIEYRKAWSQPGALTAMLNWYCAILRHPPVMPENLCIRIPTLMIWGVQDVALAPWMARPSIDYCDDGQPISSRMPRTGCSTTAPQM